MTEFAYVGTLGALPWLIAALAGMCVRNEAIQAIPSGAALPWPQPRQQRCNAVVCSRHFRSRSAGAPFPQSQAAAQRRSGAASLRLQAISPYPLQRPLPAPA